MNKIISIVGPTSTGKSDMVVDVALHLKKHGIKSEIISADSRQVYRELNLLSGKITPKETKGIPHHMIDVASIRRTFTVEQYKKKAKTIIKNLHKKDVVPIIVGGTGFYIDTLIFDLDFPRVQPNTSLRASLSHLNEKELFELLREKDVERADALGPHNRPRLIRAIEIAEALGSVPKLTIQKSPYDVFAIGLDLPDESLKEKIEKRIRTRMKQGMIEEAENIQKKGISWDRLESLGLECRFASNLLQEKINKKEFVEQLAQSTWKYTKRQRTWFKRNKNIQWIDARDKKALKEIGDAVLDFLQ